ncbi:MAG TPA: nuclear transport factor 2 family protein [Rhizomicrobium sp.]|nr:nuclear transport factor 2 family protein [Rhizomicrobium sp.]
MGKKPMSRRTLFGTGTVVLAAAAAIPEFASANVEAGLSPENEQLVRKWYGSWETRDWGTTGNLLADNFTFSSAAGDDHISKSAFKKQCWETQIDHIKQFSLLHVFGSGNEALVMYDCVTRNGKTLRNVEFLRLNAGKVAAIECYFGAQSSFPSAVSAGRT